MGRVGLELDRVDVFQVAKEGEKSTLEVVVPHLDLVVVAAGHDKRLVEVEGRRKSISRTGPSCSSHDPVYHGRDAVVPQLDDAVAEGRAYPRTAGVEGQALHPGGLLFVNML